MDKCRAAGDVTPNGIVFDWGLAGPGGAWFYLIREPQHTDADIKAAKAHLRATRDVVGITIAHADPTLRPNPPGCHPIFIHGVDCGCEPDAA
jgi:hypothetical protein